MTRRQPRPRASGLTAGLAALGALTCTSDASGPDPNAVATVTITPRAGTVDTGDSLALAVVVRNALGDPLPGRVVTWTALDTAVATVSATGTARAVWPGTARIVAASEGRADTARLHVAARITSVTLHPTLDSLASLGDELTLSLQAFIGSRAHAGGSFAWTVSDTGVARLTVTGDSGAAARLVARANGTTRVSVREARGAADSGIVVVRQRVATVEVTPSPAMVYRSCPAPLAARPLDARHNPVAHASVSWGSSDTTRAAVDSTGLLAPRSVGTAVVTASADGISGQSVVTIAAAPPFDLSVIGVGGPVSSLGVSQYAAGRGASPVPTAAPARFTVVSSDTSRLAVEPASVGIGTGEAQVDGFRLLGRGTGSVTLTPSTCDVPGPAAALTVTPARLFLFDALPSAARTDDVASFDYLNTGDTTGAPQYPAESLTVRLSSTDSLVLRPDPPFTHFAPGVAQVVVGVHWVGPGVARLVAEDSAGRYLPDSGAAIQVTYPPLLLFSDTARVGMRQRYAGSVGVDRAVSGSPLRVYLTTSDAGTVRITPDSLEIPVGGFTTPVQVVGGDTIGPAVVTAAAAGRTPAQSVVIVEQSRVQIMPLFGFGLPHYPGDPGGQLFISSAPTVPAEDVTFTIGSSDPTVVAVDSGTLTIRAGQGASAPATVRFNGPGSAVLTARDPRAAFYRYEPDSSPAVTVVERRLAFDDTVVVLAPGQHQTLGIRVAGAIPADLPVSLTHTSPGVATLSATVTVIAGGSRYGAVLATGVGGGIDTVVVTAAGWLPDTVLVAVEPGLIALSGWPATLLVGDSAPVVLEARGPDGTPREVDTTTTFALAPSAHIALRRQGASIASVQVPAGSTTSAPFFVRGVAPGTGTVTVSAAGYAALAASVMVSGPGVVLVGAGDIADCASLGDEATALLLDSIPGTVFTAGDNAYGDGTAEQFATCYDPTWGRHRARTRPSPGNHDYNTSGASAYYAYFGDAAGPAGRGYYSYDLGAWHVISLNSEVSMSAGSAQEQWLRADLAASTAHCTIAYWHRPRFSSGRHGSSTGPAPLWQALYDAGGDVVLVGHDHNYQRFAPQTAAGARDDERGIRQFVIGTGGRDHYAFATPIANTEAYDTDTHGVLKLTLYEGWYAWEFIPVAGGAFRDAGTGTCH